MKKQIIIPTVALFIICLVATTLLALANNVTAPIIEKNSAESEAQSRMEVLADAKSFEDKDDIADAITRYNDGTSKEQDVIHYTDMVALLMSSITGIISGL